MAAPGGGGVMAVRQDMQRSTAFQLQSARPGLLGPPPPYSGGAAAGPSLGPPPSYPPHVPPGLRGLPFQVGGFQEPPMTVGGIPVKVSYSSEQGRTYGHHANGKVHQGKLVMLQSYSTDPDPDRRILQTSAHDLGLFQFLFAVHEDHVLAANRGVSRLLTLSRLNRRLLEWQKAKDWHTPGHAADVIEFAMEHFRPMGFQAIPHDTTEDMRLAKACALTLATGYRVVVPNLWLGARGPFGPQRLGVGDHLYLLLAYQEEAVASESPSDRRSGVIYRPWVSADRVPPGRRELGTHGRALFIGRVETFYDDQGVTGVATGLSSHFERTARTLEVAREGYGEPDVRDVTGFSRLPRVELFYLVH